MTTCKYCKGTGELNNLGNPSRFTDFRAICWHCDGTGKQKMSDAISHSHRAQKLREAQEKRERIIALGAELTELRARKEEISLLIKDLDQELTELLK
jgi:DnaJ-class molecular chaperone